MYLYCNESKWEDVWNNGQLYAVFKGQKEEHVDMLYTIEGIKGGHYILYYFDISIQHWGQ